MKDEVLANIDELYQMITDRQSNKRGRENSVDGEATTNAHNKVSHDRIILFYIL